MGIQFIVKKMKTCDSIETNMSDYPLREDLLDASPGRCMATQTAATRYRGRPVPGVSMGLVASLVFLGILASCISAGGAAAQIIPFKELTPEQLDAMEANWRKSCDLVAEDYFEAPLTIALCHAIERNDLQEIDCVIAAGVDVNDRGKNNVTPLFWAMPFRRLERFTLLLEAGANPNVPISEYGGPPGMSFRGDTVTLTAAKSPYTGLFELVLKHGGDLEAFHSHFRHPLLHTIVGSASAHKRKRILLYKRHGGEMNVVDSTGSSAAYYAHIINDYKLAIFLCEHGVDPGLANQ